MEPLIRDPRLRKLTFTGSTAGRPLAHGAGRRSGILRVSMELGGNAPFLVFEDADVDAAVDGAMLAKMRNMGEACTAANRFFVHESLADEFSAKLAAPDGRAHPRPGHRRTASTSARSSTRRPATRSSALVDDAVAKGAKVLVGGSAPEGAGWFYEPTVLADVPTDADMAREEIFGPVAPVTTFRTDAEAIRLANDTEYGLVAYVFTRDLVAGHHDERGARVRHGRRQPGHRLQPGGARSAASRRPASGARAASRASTSTSRRSTSASPSERRRHSPNRPGARVRCGAICAW